MDRMRARQRALGLPENFEWVAETTPTLRAAALRSGLVVREHPLLVLGAGALLPVVRHRPDGVTVRMVAPADPALSSALTVPHLAFAEPGGRVGATGLAELVAALPRHGGQSAVRTVVEGIRAGRTAVAAAVDDESGLALCAGQRHVVADVSEIVGVGTLPRAGARGDVRARDGRPRPWDTHRLPVRVRRRGGATVRADRLRPGGHGAGREPGGVTPAPGRSPGTGRDRSGDGHAPGRGGLRLTVPGWSRGVAQKPSLRSCLGSRCQSLATLTWRSR